MEADPINVLLYDIREMKKRLDEMEKALLMLKARLIEKEEAKALRKSRHSKGKYLKNSNPHLFIS